MRLRPERARPASPARAPQLSVAQRAAREAQANSRRKGEAMERRSVLRGLVALVLLALIFAWLRAGVDRAFYTGWWQQW